MPQVLTLGRITICCPKLNNDFIATIVIRIVMFCLKKRERKGRKSIAVFVLEIGEDNINQILEVHFLLNR